MVRVTTTLLVMLGMGVSALAIPGLTGPAGVISAAGPARAQDTTLGDLVEKAETEKVDGALPEDVVLLDDADLDTLVAPVALYPDALLAQVLVAATFPLQIVKADRVIADSEGMSDEELKAAIAEQEWDPSVLVLLSGFPTVVQRMSHDLEWTEKLGNAMVQQDDDVLDAVQRMRAEAHDTGYLATNEAQTVEEDDGHIYITPTDPKVIYVPTYDTQTVYTQAPTAQPYIQPYTQTYVQPQATTSSNPLANPLLAGALGFGGALLVQELWGDDNDDDNNDGWDDYWYRKRPIDYRNRQFYPRPRPVAPGYAWAHERDRYWDRRDWAWRRDAMARREWDEDRRGATRWVQNPITGAPQIAHMRDRIRLTPAQDRNRITIDRNEERLKQEQQRRQQQARQEKRIEAEKADARRDARLKAERQAEREKAAKQEARKKAEAQAGREQKARAAARAREQEKAAQQKAAQKKADQKAAQQRAEAQERAEQQRAAEKKAQAQKAKNAQKAQPSQKAAERKKADQQQKAQQQKKAQPQKKEAQPSQKQRKKICAEDDKTCKQQNR